MAETRKAFEILKALAGGEQPTWDEIMFVRDCIAIQNAELGRLHAIELAARAALARMENRVKFPLDKPLVEQLAEALNDVDIMLQHALAEA